MQSATLDHHFANLDLTDPGDLLIAFHMTRHWPRTPPMDDTECARQYAVLEHYVPMIFDVPHDDLICDMVVLFLEELGGTRKHVETGNIITVSPLAKREWLHVFRMAHHRGVLSAIAFGAIVRFFMCRTGGNGAPMHPADSLAARKTILQDVRAASPQGLMRDVERDTLANAPATVTLWRGGNDNGDRSTKERAQALHWAVERGYAAAYLRVRSEQRLLALARAKSLAPLALGLREAKRAPGSSIAPLAAGHPFLLRAQVPKEMVLAFLVGGPFNEDIEVFLDFEKLTPDMLHDTTPKDCVGTKALWR